MAVVGIDLGTTNSEIAYIDEYNKPVVIPNKDGNNITPSVICFDGNSIIIGEEAKELQALGTYDIAAFFKRQMGDETFTFYSNGVDYTATELSAMILKKLKDDAEFFLGKKISDAVITVPAYFKEKERQSTIDAGKKAGLNVLQVINEPTAAAVAYGLKNSSNQTVLVYDLGGGTFDVTIMKIQKNVIKILNSTGDHHLGGKDWDDKIISYLSQQFEEEFGVDPLQDSESVADLLIRAEEAKKQLTKRMSTNISISYDGMKGRYTLTRAIFDDLTADLMERTVSLTQQALDDIELNSLDIDNILLVGGSTRMPMVHDFIEERFFKKPLIGVNVDEAVALGASIVAYDSSKPKFSLGGQKIKDVTNHSLGMIAINEDNTKYVNSFILSKNQEVPCIKEKTFTHRVSKTTANKLEIFLTQGEDRVPDSVDYLGMYVVDNIPYEKSGIVNILIKYEYDISGVVNVSAYVGSKKLPIQKYPLPYDVPSKFMQPPEIEIVEVVPVFTTVYLAFDISYSMDGAPLREAKKAAKGFVEGMNLDYSAIGLIVFSDKVKTVLNASQKEKKIYEAIDKITVGETGCCNDADPFNKIYELLEKEDDRKFALVLADGMWSYQDKAITEAKRCHSVDIDIVAIGFGGADKIFLEEIASSKEGSIFTTQEGLVETFSTIAQEISSK
ncbi:MAG TPA: VWA domain-containing protein [Sulfurospirillum arcachonense]|nr:VWA domain-containing protein [Sulfurospirillum arcachonense]